MEKELLQLEKYIDEIVGLMEDTADNTKLIKEIRTDIDSLKEDTTKTAKEFKAEILDIKELISKVKTIKGEDGIDGRDGKDGLNGKDGKDGRDGVNGEDGTNGKDGINGADGSPDTPKDIKEKLETLKKDKRLDASAIKGIDERFKQTQKDWSDAINRIMLVATGGNNGGGTGTVTGTGEADKLAYWTSATNLSYKTNTKIKSSGQLQINVAGVPVASDDTYVLSLQNTGSQYSWLEFLNNGGTGKGAFIGLDTNSLQFFNWQGGDIQFWTDTSASSGVQRMTIANSGLVSITNSLNIPNTTATAGIIFQNSARLVHSYRNNAAKTNFFAGLNAGNLATALTGGDNTGLGLSALNAITTGSRNFAGGTQAGQLLTTGDDNLFFGALAGWQSAVGISRNSVLGSTAGAYMNGSDNIYAGYSTASALTGSYNVLIGNEIASDISFIYNLTGATAIGYQALMVGEGSDYCTAIGYQAGYNDSGYTGCIYIGYQAGGATANDQLFIANDSSGIPTIGGDLTNNKVGINTAPASILARLHVTESTLGNAVHKLESTATNDDVSEIVYQNRVATTNATVTTLHTFTIPASTTYAIESIVIARRTGGASGTAEDGARYKLSAVYKSVAGTATIIGAVTKVADEDQAGWDANLTVSAGTVLLQVTGATNNNITWHTTSRIYSLSS